MSTTQTNLPPFPSPDAEEEKNNPKKWVSLSQEDLDTLANLFTHFNPKTVHTAVRDICIRLAHSSPRRELPYIALSTLGATHADLDFFKGGAAHLGKSRQVWDSVSGESSGCDWQDVPQDDLARLKPGQPFEQLLRQPHCVLPLEVSSLLRQVIVQDKEGNDLALTPLGALGLSHRIIDRLTSRLSLHADKKTGELPRPFWRTAVNNLGGSKANNLGLIGSIRGGRRVASFAWFFPAPGFPSLRVRKNLAVLFRSFQVPLYAPQVKRLRESIEAYEAHPNMESEAKLTDVVSGLARRVQRYSLHWGEELKDQLWRDTQKDRVSNSQAEEGMDSPAAAWRALWEEGRAPESNAQAWEFLLSKGADEQAWIFPDRRTHQWAKRVSNQISGRWLAQMRMPVSDVTRHLVNKKIVQELV